MKKTLRNKLVSAVAGMSLIGLVGVTQVNNARADDNRYGPTDFGREFIEEVTPLGIPIKILRGIFGSETKVYANTPQTTNYRNRKELPLVFLCTGGINSGEEYEGVGTKVITPDIEEYYIVGRAPIFKMGKNVINVNECVTTGEKFPPFKKILEEGEWGDFVAVFYPKGGFEYARKHGLIIAEWKNTWYVDGKEVGSVTTIDIDTEMLAKQQRLKNENQSQ